MSLLQFLPTKSESHEVLRKRYLDLIRCRAHGEPYQGEPMNGEEAQVVLVALIQALKERTLNPQEQRHQRRRRNTGKTARDRRKGNYLSPEERKKKKSEESARIRREMQGVKGKK